MEINTTENLILLSLIKTWWKSDDKAGKPYQDVISELLNGNSYLYIENMNPNYNEIKLSFNIYQKEGKNYLTAFTDLDLLSKWIGIESKYVKLETKDLMKMTEQIDIDGIIINTHSENSFGVFINKNFKS